MALDRKKRPRDRMRMRKRMRSKGGPGGRRRSEVGVCESEAVDEGACMCERMRDRLEVCENVCGRKGAEGKEGKGIKERRGVRRLDV